VIRRLRRRGINTGILIVLRVYSREIAASQLGVILLFAVSGERMPRQLATGSAVRKRESGKEEGIGRSPFLDNVQHLFDSLIQEGDRSRLYPDHLSPSFLGGAHVPE